MQSKYTDWNGVAAVSRELCNSIDKEEEGIIICATVPDDLMGSEDHMYWRAFSQKSTRYRRAIRTTAPMEVGRIKKMKDRSGYSMWVFLHPLDVKCVKWTSCSGRSRMTATRINDNLWRVDYHTTNYKGHYKRLFDDL